MSEDKVILTKEEYQEIINEIEILSDQLEQNQDEPHDWMLFSSMFWDSFFTKIISNFVSIKVWILVFVLYVPYQLLLSGKITSDHYTNILIVVAPIVVGLREFSKAKVNGSSDQETGLLGKARKLFKI